MGGASCSITIYGEVTYAGAAANITNYGTFSLYGKQNYSGKTIINHGTMAINGGTFPSGVITNNGTIVFAGGSYVKSERSFVESNLASGKELWETKNYVSVQNVGATIRAKIGEYSYSSFPDAYNEADNGDKIVLYAKLTQYTQKIEKNLTIDLNGYDWEFLFDASNSYGVDISSNKKLTITDSKGTGHLISYTRLNSIRIGNGAELTLDNVNVSFPVSTVVTGYRISLAYANASLIVKNSTITCTTGSSSYGVIEGKYATTPVTIENSTINSNAFTALKTKGSLTCTNTNIVCEGVMGDNLYGIYLDGASANLTFNSGNISAENTNSHKSVGVALFGNEPKVTVIGGSITAESYAIANNGSQTTNSAMTINGGTLTASEGTGIYHAGTGTLNISGENTVISGAESGIEIRAGELNMTGGKVISTWEGSESESWGNGNGTTTVGAGIAVVQHTTTQPITVTISGGDIDAIIPVKLANPQGNPDEYINTVNVAINGGRYKVTNGASAPFWSVTDNFAVSAGKFSHMPAYVVAGKTVVPNTGDDKNIYPWAIGVVNANPITPTGDITWQTSTDWPNDQVPTSQDQVTLTTGQNIVVSGSLEEVAQAYSITIPTGATLTVESGATLIVGGGGITNEGGETNINGLKVEPGAQVIVSPDADMTGLYGRVAFKPNVGKYPANMVGAYVSKPNRYQLMGVPTKGVPAVTKNKDDGDGFKLNQWDVETGWMAAAISDFTPFKGFFFWNDVPVNDDAPDLVTYYFKGELFGNKPQTLVFTEHEGFHLFANSYLAEVDIMALIQGAENNVQKAVYVYDPVQERFLDISYATYGKLGVPTAIQPMQGFYFLNQHDETTTAPMDYVSMVWSNAFKVEQELVPTSAPARQQSEQMTEVRVSLTDNVIGRNDGVYLMEREEVNEDANIRKMMNPVTSVNVYVANENTQLSQMQTTNLDGQALTITTNAAISYTFSFDWVQGEQYYLNDAVTGISTPMSEGNTYTFTAQPNSTITGRFTVVRYAPSVVTDIQTVDAIPAVKGIYTITGQYVGNEQVWESLPAGVYIVNGEKMVK